MDNVFIYSLTDPRDGNVKYVGKAFDPESRLSYHIKNRNQGATAKNHWIKYLMNNNMKPQLSILDEVPESEWQLWERYWIAQIKAWGFPLKNGDNGGLGSGRLNNSTKARISKTLTGRTNPDRYVKYLQFDLDGTFLKQHNSLKAVKKLLGLDTGNSNIGTASKNHGIAYGFIWIKEGLDIPEWFKAYDEKLKQTKKDRQLRASILADEYLKGKTPSKEARERMSNSAKGRIPWNKGLNNSQSYFQSDSH